MTVREIEKSLDIVDQFRQANASIVIAIHKLPDEMESRETVEKEVRRLFFNLRDQIQSDNQLGSQTPFSKMPDDTIITEEAKNQHRALLAYIENRQSRR